MFIARNMYSKGQMEFISVIYLASKGCLSVSYTDHSKLIKDDEIVMTRLVKFHSCLLSQHWLSWLVNKAFEE